jgi:hypothetical protein
MSDFITTLIGTPIPTLLVISGFIFLFLGIATIKKPIVIAAVPTTRRTAFVIGIINISAGMFLFSLQALVQISTPIVATHTSEVNIISAQQTAIAQASTMMASTQQQIPTATPRINPVEIAVLNINTTTQTDGTIKNTANLSINPMGIGTLQLTSPKDIKLGDSSVVRLTITPDSVLAGLPKVTAPTLSGIGQGYVLEFSDSLQIYPVMIAELKGVNFEIESDNHPEKPVISSMPVEWIWNITPLSAGKQTLILAISVPVIIDQTRDVISAQTLKNIPIEIQVEVSPTPKPTQTPISTFTPTPLPPIARIGEKLIENSSAVIIAIIGLIGVLAGIYVTYINAQKTKATKPATRKAKKK